MEKPVLEVVNLSVDFDFKKIKNCAHPAFLLHQDAITQYVGIWAIIMGYVQKLNAKKVLEFGTREGYSTQLFSHLLRATEGHLLTVDLNEPKIAPEIKEKMDNVTFLQRDILAPDWWDESVDILYIDDWHNPFHLFGELDRFSKYAKVILIHDVVQNMFTNEWLMPSIFSWCLKENMPFTVYPLNACGLVAIHRQEYEDFYEVEK